ncbi:MAG: potassium channel family protein [Candidatus Obscuribacterales bacterium]
MLESILGITLVTLVLFDVFQTIVVPRVSPRTFRIAPILLGDVLWPPFRRLMRWKPMAPYSRELLDSFAPVVFVALMLVWLLLLTLGFALIIYSLRLNVTPMINSFWEAYYFAGTSVLTLGFGDVVALGVKARFVVLSAATCGLLFMALAVSYLFSLQSLVQQREQLVNTVISRAGAPASGLVIMLRYKELNILPVLYANFLQWEGWIAGILESHRAYPMLLYFRSSNNTDSWLSVVGAMLDASSLIVTTIKDVSHGEAELFYWLACSTVKAICSYFRLSVVNDETLTFEQFKAGIELLKDAGYTVADPELAWKLFKVRRTGYLPYIRALSEHFLLPRQTWLHELAISQISVKDSVEDSVFQPQV